MNISKSQYSNLLFLLFFLLFLFNFLFSHSNYLVENGYLVKGNNIQEKYTNYSTLTSDIGTNATIYSKDKLTNPINYTLGYNNWTDKFNESKQLFDERYKPSGLHDMPSYPNRSSTTGIFIDEGPLSSNAYLV